MKIGNPVHINKANIHKHFAQSEIKHFLPFHRMDVIQNLFSIFHEYVRQKYNGNMLVCPDKTMKIQQIHPHYHRIDVLWEEDFDHTQDHLIQTLGLGTQLINYLHSFKDDDKKTKDKNKQQQVEQNCIRRHQLISVTQNGINNQKFKYNQLESNLMLCCYNFVKLNQKIYALFGFVKEQKNNFCTLLGNTRQWNIKRLNVDNALNQYSLDLIDRIVQHLFTSGRGMIRQCTDDYNTHHANLKNYLKEYSKIQSEPEKLVSMTKNHRLFQGNLSYIVKLLKTKITYRKQIKQQLIWSVICQALTQWILQTPVNTSCSYAAYIYYQEKNNSFTLCLGLHYQSGNYIEPNSTDIDSSCNKIQGLLLDINLNKNRANQIMQQKDNMLKKSFAILEKYQGEQKNIDLSLSQVHLKRGGNDDTMSKMNESFISNVSNTTQMRKINMKKIAKLENQIYEILKILNANEPILTPTEIQNKIKTHIKWLNKRYRPQKGYRDQLSSGQYLMFESLKALTEELSPQDISLLIKYHEGYSSSILTTFMQPSNYDKSITLGKVIGLQHLQDLFKKSLEKGISEYRHSIIPFYLKKLIDQYSPRQLNDWVNLQIDQVSIPQLIQLLETKNFDSRTYNFFIQSIFPKIFQKNIISKLQIISPLLYLYTEYLLRQDHHHKQLVFSFLGQLIYQVCYYTDEAKLNSLSNAMYINDYNISGNKDKLTLKEKKIIEIIREGGFKGLGYQIKKQLYPIIEANKSFRFQEELVYQAFKIIHPLQTLKFFRLLTKTHVNDRVIKIGRFYNKHEAFTNILKLGLPAYCFILVNGEPNFIFEENQGQNQEQKSQFASISRRISSSESGIFRDIFTLNPKLKIGGVQLNQAMKILTDSRKKIQHESIKTKGIINQKNAINSLVNQHIFNQYQYIELATSLKQKYLEYHLLTEQQKSYFRQCASSVVSRKQQIHQYIVLSNKAKLLKD